MTKEKEEVKDWAYEWELTFLTNKEVAEKRIETLFKRGPLGCLTGVPKKGVTP